MKFNYLFISLFFITLIFVSGCIGGEEEKEETFFVGGSSGLELSLVGGAPPDKIYQNNPFNIELMLENKGEADIRAEDVTIVFNNAGVLGINAVQTNKEDITKRLKVEDDFIKGGHEFIMWNDARYTGSISPLPISIEACYPYATQGIASLCITQGRESSICETIGARETESSGAPVKITSVEQLPGTYMSGSKNFIANVEIRFKNTGSGEIYSTKSTSCTTKTSALKDIAILEEIKIGSKTISRDDSAKNQIEDACGTDEILFDSEGVGRLRCNLPIHNIVGDYTERMTIKLSYLHVQTLNEQIEVIVTETN